MITDYLDLYNKYKPIEKFLHGKRRRQLNKLGEWLAIEQYYMSLAGVN